MKKKILSLVLGGVMLVASVFAFAACGNGHKHTYETTYQVADCDTEGYTLHTCTDCGYKYADEFIAPYGHAYRNSYHIVNENDSDEHYSFVEPVTEENLQLFQSADKICAHKVCAFCSWDQDMGSEPAKLPDDKYISFTEMMEGLMEGENFEPTGGEGGMEFEVTSSDPNAFSLPSWEYDAEKHESFRKTTIHSFEYFLDNEPWLAQYEKIHIFIPDTIETIEYSAFGTNCCKRLERVRLSNNLKTIGQCVFMGSGIDSILLPHSLQLIDKFAFASCRDLKVVYYYGTEEEWNAINIDPTNDSLLNAPRYYYSVKKPTQPGNYWHYVNCEPTPW